MLVDGNGVPLSLVVTGANRHDVSRLEAVPDAVVVQRATPPHRRHKHLCADAGYTGAPALKVIEEHGYIPHVKGSGTIAGSMPMRRAASRCGSKLSLPKASGTASGGVIRIALEPLRSCAGTMLKAGASPCAAMQPLRWPAL